MTECPEALKASEYHDAELEESERSAFEDHLRGCSACQSALAEYESLSGACRFDGSSHFASDVERQVYLSSLYAGFEGGLRQTRERFAYPLLAAAAVLLICSLSSTLVLLRSPRHLDDVAMRWAEYMVNEPGTVDPDLELASGDEANLTEWMIRALSEDYAND